MNVAWSHGDPSGWSAFGGTQWRFEMAKHWQIRIEKRGGIVLQAEYFARR